LAPLDEEDEPCFAQLKDTYNWRVEMDETKKPRKL
jgi:hypothetical protein